MKIAAEAIERFAAQLDSLEPDDGPIGVAVSGGPDSLALLLLASAARPGRIEAATVDHGLRPESAAEAAMVAGVCERLDVPHEILVADWPELPEANVQAAARAMREAGTGFLPVLEGGAPVGVVTDRDLVVRFLAEGGGDPESTPVGEVMSRDIATIGPDEDLAAAGV